MSSFQKPSYVSSFEPKEHPLASKIIANVQTYFLKNWQWGSQEEKDHYLKQEIERCATYTQPYAPVDRAEVLTTWYTWGILLDDKMEVISRGDNSRAGHFLLFGDLILGKGIPDRSSALQSVTYDVHQLFLDVDDDESKELGRAVVMATVTWLKEVVQDSVLGPPTGPITFEAMVEKRRKTAGVWVVFLAMRWSLRTKWPQQAALLSEVQRFEDITETYCIYLNDLYSYRKEFKAAKDRGAESDTLYVENVIAAIMVENGLSEEMAIQELVRRLRGLEEEFSIAETQFGGDSNSPELSSLRCYIQALKAVMAGTNTWSLMSHRY